MRDHQNEYTARQDGVTEEKVEAGVQLATRDGVNPALDFMERAGVPRRVALRVLCGPRFKRTRLRCYLN